MVALVQHRSPPSAANALVADAANSTDSGRRRRFRRPLNPVDAFDSAAADLYVGEPAAQVSAVHALADVADGSPFTRRQQCVDVLCGYLREPWPTGRDMGDERTVRDTIVAVLADRMRRRRIRGNWSGVAIDLRNAYLENVDFTEAVFRGPALFESATLAGVTRFDGATFLGQTHFQSAVFDTAWFREAVFTDSARFFGTRFGSGRFDETTFRDCAQFPLAVFTREARFYRTAFQRGAYFDSAQFRGDADFGAADFTGPARFDGSTFTTGSSFDHARFDSPVAAAQRNSVETHRMARGLIGEPTPRVNFSGAPV
ncbi:pentapeptide repeat-containing protein [Nocardia vermiculata]|uniref:Pentapeptide repeat-containing protein n=1 Tax=Nocardia vermiculata TaxID=257274 RepID=A0A846Y0F7_9NOCA|nr:pentapeptide repeat-containing protein [Nocardia vermiculata]NKY51572.1 pentapeptide repeat-containing protein [Nocardia vermiculata]